ncbi:MAG: XrtV sorting system accessory protein, partial [Novosphingobium sp.]
MSTVFDYLTMAIFAGLIVLYLKRSSDGHDEPQHDQIWQYFVSAAGCAVA